MNIDNDMSKKTLSLHPKCIASTGDTYCRTTIKAVGVRKNEANFFHDAQFTADGTTIITHTEDQRLRTFVLPSDLLDEKDQPHRLSPVSDFCSPSNVQSYAQYPGFDLQDASTAVTLCASANVPICLRNAYAFDVVHASYKFIKESTEEYLPARSLIFSRDGSHFIAGSDSIIAVFDCSRNGSFPVSTRQLRSSRKARRLGYGIGVAECEGIVSTMSINCNRILALGTLSRQVCLLDKEGNGECITAFAVAPEQPTFGGTGVAHVRWSPCGIYLFVAERQSDAVQVFDIRNTHSNVATLIGRQAYTNQTLGIDVIQSAESYEVWAGGTDGFLRMWSDPSKVGGVLSPDCAFENSKTSVSGTTWHPVGAILATCCGSRLPADDLDVDQASHDSDHATSDAASLKTPPENILKIWVV